MLVAGATGYVGGRLVPELLTAGHEVHILARTPDSVQQRPWADQVEIHEGDLLDAASLEGVFEGVDAAYYLVHSMGTGPGFAQRDRTAAHNFADAAGGVDHVVYLGGLQPEGEIASEHLRSRAEVGAILRDRLPTLELRAGPVIGAGSGSFEMVRYLTERLPVMVAPRWIENAVQPIAVRDVIAYLLAALEDPSGGVVQIGGPDVLTFRDMMEVYADVRGLDRWITPVPVLTPHLAAQWVELVTPIPNHLAVPLIEGIVEPVTADTTEAHRRFPEVEVTPYRVAVERALSTLGPPVTPVEEEARDGSRSTYERTDEDGLIQETWTMDVDADPATVIDVVSTIGSAGEGHGDVMRAVSRLLDRIGDRPGRPGETVPMGGLQPGDTVDGWLVEQVEPGHRVRLRGQQASPGDAWLEWIAHGRQAGGCRLVQRAIFAPHGLLGTLSRYASTPLRKRQLGGLVKTIAREAEEEQRQREQLAVRR